MNRLGTVLLLIAISPGNARATPPPPVQHTANCAAPTYASDTLVCTDEDLRQQDARMRALLADPTRRPVFAPGALVEAQDAWFRRRSLCAFSSQHRRCLEAAYSQRIAELEATRAPGRVSIPHVACARAPWPADAVSIHMPVAETAVLVGAHGQVLAAASSAAPRDDWAPFVRFEPEGTTLQLVPIEGATIMCTIKTPRA